MFYTSNDFTFSLKKITKEKKKKNEGYYLKGPVHDDWKSNLNI